MKRLLPLLCAAVMSTTAAHAQDAVKIGMLQGFTGPTESLVKPMALGGEMAIQEVSDGAFSSAARRLFPCAATAPASMPLPRRLPPTV